MMRKIKTLIKKIFNLNGENLTAIQYWNNRAKRYGTRAVLNIGHAKNEIESVTRMQKGQLFPFLKEQLRNDEQVILDLGCGPGRFTSDLADLIHGKAIGIDPVKYLIDLAMEKENKLNVEYGLMIPGVFPVNTLSVDVVWCCLVLGGIIDNNILENTVLEIKRVLKNDGLLFLVENTTVKKTAIIGNIGRLSIINHFLTTLICDTFQIIMTLKIVYR